jgi:hypothetical protein
MKGVDIVGLSLAELSLALVFVVLVLARPSQKAELAAARKSIEELKNDNKQLQAAIERLRRSQESSTPGLRSPSLPSCEFVHLAREQLFTIVIAGRNEFRLSDATVTLPELLTRYQKDLQSAIGAGCVHRINVLFTNDISAPDYDQALRELDKHFYVRKLGAEVQ